MRLALAVLALALSADAFACSHPLSLAPTGSWPADGATGVPIDAAVVLVITSYTKDAVVHLVDTTSGEPVQIQKSTAKGPAGVTDDVAHYLFATPGVLLQPSTAYRIEYGEGWSATFTTGTGPAPKSAAKPGVKSVLLTEKSTAGFHYACTQNGKSLLEVQVALAAPEPSAAWIVTVGGISTDSDWREFTALVTGANAWPVFLRDFYADEPEGCLRVSVRRTLAKAKTEAVVVCKVPRCTLKSAADAPADAFPLGCDLTPPPDDDAAPPPPVDESVTAPDAGADVLAPDAGAPAASSGGCRAASTAAPASGLALLALVTLLRRRAK